MGVSRGLGRAAVVCGWALVAGMTGIGVIRLRRSDSQPQLIGLQAVGMWLLVPAYPLAVVALVTRRRALAAVAIALSIGNAAWVRELYETGQDKPAPSGAARVRVVTANMLIGNTEVGGLAGDLATTGAEVILLQEVTAEHVAELRAAGMLDAYPYQVLDPSPMTHGSAILSTLPISAGGAIEVAGYPMTRADIVTSAGTVGVVNVHTVAPTLRANAPEWRAQMTALARLAADEPGPLIMAGDFNATIDHAPMGWVLSSGLRDAFSEAGRGLGATWPVWRRPMFPVMRLDHVLVSDSVTVLSAGVQANRGSDHLRLSVDVAVTSKVPSNSKIRSATRSRRRPEPTP